MPRASAAVRIGTIEQYLRGLSEQGNSEKLLLAAMDVISRLSERLDRDIPQEDYPKLATVGGCFDYLGHFR